MMGDHKVEVYLNEEELLWLDVLRSTPHAAWSRSNKMRLLLKEAYQREMAPTPEPDESPLLAEAVPRAKEQLLHDLLQHVIDICTADNVRLIAEGDIPKGGTFRLDTGAKAKASGGYIPSGVTLYPSGPIQTYGRTDQ